MIVDLGDLRVQALWSWRGELGARESAPVAAGHTYFPWSRDPDTDLAIAFEVLELEPGNRCVLAVVRDGGRTDRARLLPRREPGHAPRAEADRAAQTCRLEIEPRGEKRTYLELLNSSVGEAILTGELVRR